MAGLHFSCGRWMVEDKSADPLFDIIPEILSEYVESEAWLDWLAFQAEINEQGDSETLLLMPEMMETIVEPQIRYRDDLVQSLGLSGPDASIEERGAFPRTETSEERRFGCVRDLLAGYKVSMQTGEPINVYFV